MKVSTRTPCESARVNHSLLTTFACGDLYPLHTVVLVRGSWLGESLGVYSKCWCEFVGHG